MIPIVKPTVRTNRPVILYPTKEIKDEKIGPIPERIDPDCVLLSAE